MNEAKISAKVIFTAALAATSVAAAVSPTAAAANPSVAQPFLGHSVGSGAILYHLEVSAAASDPAPHSLVVGYDGAALVISDTAGIIPQPPGPLPPPPESQNDPEDTCLPVDASHVRCPIRLDRADLTQTEIEFTTGAAADRVDLGGLPKLRGTQQPASVETKPGPAAPRVSTGAGDDIVTSGPAGQSCTNLGTGDDVFAGAAGDDCVSGSRGRDRLDGGAGKDLLFGDAGNDRLTGGPGRDSLSGDEGNDRLFSRDGTPDRISCGPGARGKQSAIRDRLDRPFKKFPRYARRINCG